MRQIRKAAPTADVRGLGYDLASLHALRSLAERLSAEEEQLDVLVNNAGTMPDQRERSPDGHEVMFATHVHAPFALTSWLTETLARSARAARDRRPRHAPRLGRHQRRA